PLGQPGRLRRTLAKRGGDGAEAPLRRPVRPSRRPGGGRGQGRKLPCQPPWVPASAGTTVWVGCSELGQIFIPASPHAVPASARGPSIRRRLRWRESVATGGYGAVSPAELGPRSSRGRRGVKSVVP